MDEEKRILRAVFGESSDSEEGEQQCENQNHNQNQNQFWERFKEIDGLWLCRDFLSPECQSSLLSAIDHEGWFTEASHNQAMRFGDLPEWAVKLSAFIHDVVDDFFCEVCGDANTCACATAQHKEEARPLPLDLLWREPLFDQLIVNVYQPGEGICRHVDLMRFADGIAIVSLESVCVMHFTWLSEASSGKNGEEEEGSPTSMIPVLLTPGSLVLMSGEARYRWMHEINRKPGFQVWEGHEIHQQKRTSVTLRKLCEPK